ncbi:MAG: L-histidine N(alpha)-methyltransferase, partial [Gemmatimonadota bacterium]|nr:L-histidine N(alpha)-methyltransferase [Gemmatimonadota bacterium]
ERTEGRSDVTGREAAAAGAERAWRLEERESPFHLADDARAGLTASPKAMSPKYFYDARGSRLFEEITRQPEYYPTEAEREILRDWAAWLAARTRSEVLVEFGSGNADKTRVLLDALRDAGTLEGYAPIDVSADASRRAAEALIREYPGLRVEGVIGDFVHPHDLPFGGRRRLFAFLGSTIGNFERAEAAAFLSGVAGEMRDGDALLIGFDLVKDREILERAYNDAAGVTAEFNRNLLRVLNRELGADFDPDAFAHRAFWNAAEERIEMHLVSRAAQTVHLEELDLDVSFAAGESVRTELSHKFTPDSARRLLAGAGLRVEGWRTDARGRYALCLAVPDGEG